MTPGMVTEAFRAETESMSDAIGGEDDASFARPSPCPPWTVGELVYHVRMAIGRLPGMVAAPEPGGDNLVTAAGYYKADPRFSPATNAERIASAQRGADALGSAAALVRDFESARREAVAAVRAASPARVVLTRHGDRMLLGEFLRTRVLEVAVHGLDLAAGLDRRPWMTPAAASVIEEMVMPPGATGSLRQAFRCDHAELIAMVTGRRPLSDAQALLIERCGVLPLVLR